MISTDRRLPLVTNDNCRETWVKTPEAPNIERRFPLVAFVLLPEHLHLSTYPMTGMVWGG